MEIYIFKELYVLFKRLINIVMKEILWEDILHEEIIFP